jgi:hypothetical protein
MHARLILGKVWHGSWKVNRTIEVLLNCWRCSLSTTCGHWTPGTWRLLQERLVPAIPAIIQARLVALLCASLLASSSLLVSNTAESSPSCFWVGRDWWCAVCSARIVLVLGNGLCWVGEELLSLTSLSSPPRRGRGEEGVKIVSIYCSFVCVQNVQINVQWNLQWNVQW